MWLDDRFLFDSFACVDPLSVARAKLIYVRARARVGWKKFKKIEKEVAKCLSGEKVAVSLHRFSRESRVMTLTEEGDFFLRCPERHEFIEKIFHTERQVVQEPPVIRPFGRKSRRGKRYEPSNFEDRLDSHLEREQTGFSRERSR